MSTRHGVPTPLPGAFGRVVRRMRRERNWTQFNLAERADVSRRMVAEYETGGSERPPYEVVSKIAAAFEMKGDELWTLVTSEEENPTDRSRLDVLEARVDLLTREMRELSRGVVSVGKGAPARQGDQIRPEQSQPRTPQGESS